MQRLSVYVTILWYSEHCSGAQDGFILRVFNSRAEDIGLRLVTSAPKRVSDRLVIESTVELVAGQVASGASRIEIVAWN